MTGAPLPGQVAGHGGDARRDGGTPGPPAPAPSAPVPPAPIPPAPVPPEIAARIVRAIDRTPSTVVTLIDSDLRIRWVSHSATWVTGIQPSTRSGASSLERIHPDDVDRLVQGLEQLRTLNAVRPHAAATPQPIRYRFQRPDGRWVVMEATVHNLLDDPVVDGLLVFSRPVGGEVDGVGHVIDLLVAEVPLPEVLAACAVVVPSYVGVAAVVAFVDGGTVIGAPAGTAAERLVADARWWRPARRGRQLAPVDFAGFPDDLAASARAEGFASAWALPVHDQPSGEVIGCVMVWVKHLVEQNIATDEALRHPQRLASLVIAEERRRHALRRLAVTDPLTGLANRSAFERRLTEGEGPVTVAILDLDDFKPVNDTHGHDTGDSVLRVVAERLRNSVREDDLAVRFGGDEFAIVFAPGTDHDDAVRSAQRVVAAIEAPIALERPADASLTVSVGASVGVATAPAKQATHLADNALYEAKRTKRVR